MIRFGCGVRLGAQLSCCIFLLAAFLPGAARAQVGKRNFFQPLITEDANPSNTLELNPLWVGYAHGSNFSLSFSLEKKLSQNFSVELSSAWNHPQCESGRVCHQGVVGRRNRLRRRRQNRGQALSGFDDLEALFKYAFVKSDAHELRIAFGMDSFYPTGNPSADANTHAYMGPILMISKGMGDIPDYGFARYLRPFALQADAEYLMRTSGAYTDDAAAAWVVSYSFDYLEENVRDVHMPAAIRNLIPFAEFSYEQILCGSGGGSAPALMILPGVAYMTDTWQISIAAQFAMNNASVALNHAGVFAMLNLVLDQIFPQFGWTPL